MLKTLALSAIAGAAAHLCTLTPLQRGGIAGAEQPAADVCLQVQGPCGSAPAGPANAAWIAGDAHHLDLLKNQDHYPTTPGASAGNFSAYLWGSAGAAPIFLCVSFCLLRAAAPCCRTLSPHPSLISVFFHLLLSQGLH